MVFAAAGAASGVPLRAALVVTARLRAIEQFQRLSRILLTSNNAFIKFGRSTLIAAGAMEVLRRSIGLLLHPVTGLIGLLELGLATRNWLIFERSIRTARLQISLMGLETSRANQRLQDMRTILGSAAAGEIFRAADVISNLLAPALGEDLVRSLLETATQLGRLGIMDEEAALRLFAEAALGSASGLQALKDAFPGIKEIEDAKTFRDVFTDINQALEDMELSNMERLTVELGRIQDRVTPLFGRINDFIALIPLAVVLALGFIVNRLFDMARGVRDFFSGIIQTIGTLMDTLGETVFRVLFGQFNRIPELWSDALREMQATASRALDGLLAIWTLGMNRIVGRAGDIVAGWIRNSVVPAFTQLFTVLLPGVASEFFGPGLGGIMLRFFQRTWSTFWRTILPISIRDFIIGTSSMISGWLFGIGERLVRFFVSTWSTVWLRLLPTSVTGFITRAVKFLGDFFNNTVPRMLTVLSRVMSGVWRGIGNTISRIWNGVVGSVRRGVNSIIGMLNSIVNKINAVIRAFNRIPLIPNIPTLPGVPTIPTPPSRPIFSPPPSMPIGPFGPGSGSPITLAHGGPVPGARGQPVMAVVHGGERVIPEGQVGQGQAIHIYIGDRKVDTVVLDSLGRIMKRSGVSPRSLSSP